MTTIAWFEIISITMIQIEQWISKYFEMIHYILIQLNFSISFDWNYNSIQSKQKHNFVSLYWIRFLKIIVCLKHILSFYVKIIYHNWKCSKNKSHGQITSKLHPIIVMYVCSKTSFYCPIVLVDTKYFTILSLHYLIQMSE